MKIAVLFSLVVLVLVAFLNTASGCDCVTFLNKSTKKPAVLKSITIPAAYAKQGPKVVCAKMPKVKAILAKQPCSAAV
jgi:hypothetical protein